MEKKPLVLYHANCNDGFGAAWAFWNTYPEWQYRPATHGEVLQGPEFYTDRDIYLVDFSYKKQEMMDLVSVASKVTVIDHHVGAEKELKELIDQRLIRWDYDVEKSGAMLAWEYLNGDTLPPVLLDHIQDRDLWKFELEGTNEVHAALAMYPMLFKQWDKLMNTNLWKLIGDGEIILKVREKEIERIINTTQRPFGIAGWTVPLVNSPIYMSEIGNKLANIQGVAFGAVYWDDKDGRKFSLRSIGEFDVQTIATHYGGGGHLNAAGFNVGFMHELCNR